jgi:uncharacterized protein (DUF1684 family)
MSAQADWQRWLTSRDRAVRSARGPLALTGTHWFDPELVLDGLPGRWRVTPDGVTLTAATSDGVRVDGVVLDGTVHVPSDLDDHAPCVEVDGVNLVLIDREGAFGVRVYDSRSPALQSFRGIDRYPFDERWVRPALFTPYDTERTVRIEHVDGVERGLPLGGEVAFDLDGATVRLAVEVDPPTGGMQAVLSDTTSGRTSYRFRFLDLDAPDAAGAVTADLNRLRLPPCAFSEHFVCPFPPTGNRLDIALAAGERWPLWPGSRTHP